MSVHPDKTASRAVDACGGVFPRAKNDYDLGWQAGHEAALSAAIGAVHPVDELTADLLAALKEARTDIIDFVTARWSEYEGSAQEAVAYIDAAIYKAEEVS